MPRLPRELTRVKPPPQCNFDGIFHYMYLTIMPNNKTHVMDRKLSVARRAESCRERGGCRKADDDTTEPQYIYLYTCIYDTFIFIYQASARA